MPVYIVLFRGVGGATQLPVAPLREALAAAGFENVATYINSGNAVVKSHLPATKIVSTIAGICSSALGFEKAIYALTLAEWDRIIANCPFQPAEGKFLHAAWLERDPDPGKIEALSGLCMNGDQFCVIDKVAYIHTPRGFSKSKLAERFDKWIGVPNTARNWNTVLKLRELAVRAQ